MAKRSTEFEQVMTLLKTMPAEDLAQLHQHLKAMSATGAVVFNGVLANPLTVDSRDGINIVMVQLLRFLKTKGCDCPDPSIPAISRILQSSVGKGAGAKIVNLWSFVKRQFPRRTEREALLSLLFTCHYEQLNTWMSAVGLNEMLMHLEKAQTNLDACFPGYAEAGLLGFIIRA